MKRFVPGLTYANVVSTLCLFLLLGGGAAWAATHLAKNSVGARQLKKGAVTSAKVKNGTLQLGDFKAAERAKLVGPAGPQGPKGAPGPTGVPGAPGATNVVVREEDFGSVPKETFYSGRVFCEPGEVATGGGAGFTENGGREILEQSYPVGGTKEAPIGITPGAKPTGWAAFIRNNNPFPLAHVVFYVVCAKP